MFAVTSKISSKSIVAVGYTDLIKPRSQLVEVVRIHIYVPADPGSDKKLTFYHTASDKNVNDLSDIDVCFLQDISMGMTILTQRLGQGITVDTHEKLLVNTPYAPIYINIYGAIEQIFSEAPIK